MFERAHHRDVALVLQSLDPQVLAARHCWFGGGTAMALRYGEYRESVDIDFLVCDRAGYRDLRRMLGDAHDLGALLRQGTHLELTRGVRADQYGIRTQVRSGTSVIKLEIVLEARIEFEAPGRNDVVCGVTTLTPLDLATEKLLANADRWADDAVFSRDLIDLAMLPASTSMLRAACEKAEAAYGDSVRGSLHKAMASLRTRRHRLEGCMQALAMMSVSRAALWQSMRRVERALPLPAT